MAHLVGHVRRRSRRFAAMRWAGGSEAVRRALRGAAIQPKLKVGPPDDAYEREADAVAARVMADTAPQVGAAPGHVQRACAACEEEALATPSDEIQRQPAEEEDEEVQKKALPDSLQGQPMEEEEEEPVQAKQAESGFAPGSAVAARAPGLGGPGQPLQGPVRSFFEPRFGADFSDVRVHTGPPAAAAARALRARAFTSGRDVVFGEGEYAPGSRAGAELLAHELVHVIQQRNYRRRPEGPAPAPLPVRRWQIGAAPVPEANWSLVPQDPRGEDHTARLNAAENLVRRVLASRRCVNFFRNNCGLGEGDAALQNAFDQARIYFMDSDDTTYGEQSGTSRNIAYNRRAFRIGRFFMASSLLHEMFHTCDPNFDAQDEIDAETAVERCRLYTPFIEDVTPTSGAAGDRVTISGGNFGGAQGSADSVLFDGVPATIISWGFTGAAGSSEVQIVCEVPAGAATGPLVVVNNNVRSNARRFRIV
jgi:hypothetical protein